MKRFFVMILVALVSVVSFYSLNAQEFVSTSPQGRTAVLEEFTGIYCVYCPQGHAIAQSLYEKYPGKFMAINIHQGGYATPQKASDPDFRTQWGDAIAGISGLTGYPAGQVNRELFNGATALAMGRGSWENAAGQVLNSGNSPVNVAVRNTFDQNANKVTIEVEMYYTAAAGQNNKLNVAILENGVVGHQTGGEDPENYVHNHILRDLITGQWGETITETTQGSYVKKTYEYTFPDGIIAGNCDVAAFVSKNDNRYIYTGHEQSVAVRYKVFSEVDKIYYSVVSAEPTLVSFTLTNPNDVAIDVETTFDGAQLVDGWDVNVIDELVNIPAGGTANVTAEVVGESIAYLPIEFKSTPVNLPEGTAGVPAKSAVGVLHEETENVFFFNYDSFINISANAFFANGSYGPATAFVPLDLAAFEAYPADNFNMVGFTYSGTNAAFFSINETDKAIIDATYNYINTVMDNGGNVLVTADLALYYLTNESYTPNANAKQLLQTEMGISATGTIYNYVQDNQLYTFELKGMADTPFSGLRLDGNKVYSQSFAVYQQYMDAMKLGANAKAIPLLYNSADATVFPMVGYENEAGGKIVYSAVNFGVIGANSADQTQRNALYNAVVEWFEGGESSGSGILTTSIGDGTIKFDDTYIDEFNYYDLEVTNTGDKELNLTGVQLLNNSSNAFSIASGGGGFTLDPKASKTIKIMFNPKAEGNFTATLRLISDATNNEVDINIEAAAVINSVKDGVSGNESIFTMQVGPNPIISAGTISYSINGASSRNVKIDLVNSKGLVVAQIVNGTVATGTHTIDLNSNDFSSGNYYLIGTADGYSTQLPVVIIK